MPFTSGREEDGPEYLNIISSGLETLGRLWSGSPSSNRRQRYHGCAPSLENALFKRATRRSVSAKMPFQAGEKIRADSSPDVPCQAKETDTMDVHINEEISFSNGREDDGPKCLNDLSSGREDKDGPDYLNALSSLARSYGQGLVCKSFVKQIKRIPTTTSLQQVDVHNNKETPFSSGIEKDGPEYLNALSNIHNDSEMPISTGLEAGKLFLNGISSGREETGRLLSGNLLKSIVKLESRLLWVTLTIHNVGRNSFSVVHNT
ncbi:hypothetical protein CHS0354_005437 [Potamilus streckersoni]|uniref:Uncharacterized protein n=1 Tax=Potamilus streckersoni TaxID=2493646 RepID=A0AAE0TIT0_9BIVA|nr:hypothetical protein CHS0354_005437 [Potamilus streckersoni]